MMRLITCCLVLAACSFPDPRATRDAGGDDAATDDAAADACVPETTCAACGMVSDGCDGMLSCGPCQLLASDRSIANTGDTVMLEGTFSTTATVTFPGGVTQPATVLGAHRASVVVPAGATAGELSVTTGGMTIGPLPFRRAAFALGIQSFRSRYEQAGGGRQTPSLVKARFVARSIVIGSFLYVVGGYGSGWLNTVERAPINADGSLGAFSTAGTLAAPRAGAAVVVFGGYLYVISGESTGTVRVATIERAAIAADGTLGSFAVLSGVTLSAGRHEPYAFVIGNSLYVLAGSGDQMSTIERATIAPDGSLGAFAVAGSLLAPRQGATAVVVENNLYVIGGINASSQSLGTVEQIPINPDGTLGQSTLATSTLQGRHNARAMVLGDDVYLIGGLRDTTTLDTVDRAPIGTGGTLGNFVNVPGAKLTSTRETPALAIVGNTIHAISGRAGFTDLATVEQASINASGSLGTFAVVPGVQPVTARLAHGGAVIGDYAYLIAGTSSGSGLSSVERAPIAADGTMGAFSAVARTLVTPRDGHRNVVIGPYTYAIGGFGSNGSSDLASVERATIADDGSLGVFQTQSASLLTARAAFSTVVIGTYLYVIGGTSNATGNLASVERSTIAANGSLGTFSTVSPLTIARTDSVSVVIGNFLYVISGGSGASGDVASIERAAINSDNTLGTFAAVSSTLTIGRRHPALAVIGAKLYVIGGLNGSSSTHLTSVERATINTDSSLGSFATVSGVALTTGRFAQTTFTAGNYLYVVAGGGASGQLATVERGALE